jgi:hypothetical protein
MCRGSFLIFVIYIYIYIFVNVDIISSQEKFITVVYVSVPRLCTLGYSKEETYRTSFASVFQMP